MERNRETRRASILGSNGFNRRRQRTNNLIDSPDEDMAVELQESVRSRDRVKKDRERERDLRERPSRRKRRKFDDETSEEQSASDDEDDVDEENTTSAAAVRLLPPPPGSVSNHHHQHHLQHRKSFPPSFSSSSFSSIAFRASPVWKPADEIISVSVPRKARSVSTKRSHDWISHSSSNINGNGGGGEQIIRQSSSSPARQSGGVSTSTPSPATPMSPPISFFQKKLNPNRNNTIGPKLKPPKASPEQNSFNPEELEIEIAEVLYGLMTQSQDPSSKKDDSKEINRSHGDEKTSRSGPLLAVAPKRKRPRQVVENSGNGARPGPVYVKVEIDRASKSEVSSPNPEKILVSTAENGFEVGGNLGNSQVKQPPEPPVAEELIESRDLVIKEDMKGKESCAVKNEDNSCKDSDLIETDSSSAADTIIKANSMVCEMEIQKEQKFEIDLMAPRSSPERAAPLDQKPILSTVDAESKPVVSRESKETEANKEIENNGMNIDLRFDFENAGNKLHQQQEMPIKTNKEETLTEKSRQWKRSATLPLPTAGWPGGLPPMGYISPLQGVAVPMDGTTVATPSPIQPLFTQPRQKRCATHCYIARNIHSLQQFIKTNPFWQADAGPADPVGNLAGRDVNGEQDKGQSIASSPKDGVKDKGFSQNARSSDSAQRKPSVGPSDLLAHTFIFPLNPQQAVVAAASARPSSTKPPPTTSVGTVSLNPSSSAGANASVVAPTRATTAMSFNHPSMAANETQYLAILQNNGYPIPSVGTHPPNYRGPPAQVMPLFNGSFYPSQMIHPTSQIHHQQQTPSTQPSQNPSASNGSSSSQKNLPSHQQPRPQSSGVNNGGIGSAKSNNQHGLPSRPPGCEDSPTTTTDSCRGSWPPVKNIYDPNFAMPVHPQHPQQFAMSFGTINGTNTLPSYDTTSKAQSRAIFQSFPEATRQNIQMMAAQKNNNFRISEDDKSENGYSSTNDSERNNLAAKPQNGEGQSSIAFTRSDLADLPLSSIQATNVIIESSCRSLNVSSGAAARASPSVINNNASSGAPNVPNIHIQGQIQQHLKHLSSNSSSIMVAAKFPNVLSDFPQILVQSNNNSPAQSPQWKSSSRTPISQAQSSATTTLKNQHSRLSEQTHNQISFRGNPKPSTNSQTQAPMSPTNSSISKGASGSSRTTSSTSTNPNAGQSPIFSAKQPKNPPSNPIVAKTPMQPQLFFSNPYSQSPHSTSTSSTTSGPNGFYMQWRRPDQHQQSGSLTSSTGVLSLCSPVSTSTNDPAKAIAAATSNVKGGGLNSHGVIHTAQFGVPSGGTLLPAGFSYVHPVPAAVQVKPAEQKQPAA